MHLPVVRWNGDSTARTSDSKTRVNLSAVGDLVESIAEKLITLANTDELEVVLAGGSDELLDRYGLYRRPVLT